MEIKLGLRTGEVIVSREVLDPVDYGDLESRAEEADDPFQVVALDLLESEELHYVKWIEIDGSRKDEPFDYPGVPKWWEQPEPEEDK